MSRILLYGRSGCSLCDKAKSALEEAGIAFEEVDISTDTALTSEFGYLIPVIEVDGRTVFEAGMNLADLAALVTYASP